MADSIVEIWKDEDDSLGYEWDQFHVYEHPTIPTRYATDDQSGCSCNYYEEPTLAELRAMTPLTKAEVIEEYKKWRAHSVAGLESLVMALGVR